MPGLISSAVSGKTAAPKAPKRRRPPPAPAHTTPTAAPPSPPPTQPPAVSPLPPAANEQPLPRDSEPSVTEAASASTSEAQPTPEESRTEPTCIPAPEFGNSTSTQTSVEVPETDIVAPLTPKVTPTEPTDDPEIVETRDDNATVAPGPSQDQVQLEPQVEENARLTEKEQAQPGIEDTTHAETETQPEPPERSGVAAKRTSKRVRIEAPPARASPPAKRVKQSSTRSGTKVQAIAGGEEQPTATPAVSSADKQPEPATQPNKQKPKPKRKQPARKSTATQRKTRGRPKSSATIVDSDDEGEYTQDTADATGDAEDDDSEVPQPVRRKSRPFKKKKTRPRIKDNNGDDEQAQPQSDEEDPEMYEIDPKTLSMYDLSHNTSRGQTSELGRKMAEIDWEAIAQERRAAIKPGEQVPAGESVVQSVEGAGRAGSNADEPEAEGGEDEEQRGLENDAEVEPADEPEPRAASPKDNGDNIVYVFNEETGEMEVDEASRTINRNAAVEAAVDGRQIEDVNDLTVQINRTTWRNDSRRDPQDRVPAWKWKSDPWSEEDTDRFYDALRMFGTDFFIISKMFPPKTRRMIKAKFNREEKMDLQRVNAALSGKPTTTMSLQHYSQHTGKDVSAYTQYDSVAHAQSIISESMKEKQDAMTTAVLEEAALAEEKALKEEQEKKEKSRKPRGKGKKAKPVGTLGGGPEDVS